ncbi:toxic anion resistance protein [Brevundimonas sp.]|uniref:toxic anion resistance protein n=1 Tax=Brevundimonas sp. TaxID=1871086 RepID=UPI0025E00385|nr:toxic anion resistance protein [Brevundimonas sp.]
MTADRPFQAVPRPDAQRVGEIRMALDPRNAAAFPAFGEEARASLAAACAAVARDEGGQAADEAGRLIEALRATAGALDPRELTPRAGLMGLFDSRSGRLKRMREAFRAADARMSELTSDLGVQAQRLRGRVTDLDPALETLRAPIVELGAWIEAGRARLADTADEAPEGEAAPRTVLSERLETLAAGRMAGLGHLPLARALQNADAVAAERLDQAVTALAAWRDDWKKALGLDAKRPRRVQPDPAALAGFTARLSQAADRAQAMLADGRARRARALAKLEELRRALGD